MGQALSDFDHEQLLDGIKAKLSQVKNSQSPEELEKGTREVQIALVAARDQLIENLHRDIRPPETGKTLEQVNTALSLVIAVEFPVSSLERKKLAEALEFLRTAG